MLKEQDAKFQKESDRIVKSWHVQKEGYEHNMAAMTKMEAENDELKNENKLMKEQILVLRKVLCIILTCTLPRTFSLQLPKI